MSLPNTPELGQIEAAMVEAEVQRRLAQAKKYDKGFQIESGPNRYGYPTADGPSGDTTRLMRGPSMRKLRGGVALACIALASNPDSSVAPRTNPDDSTHDSFEPSTADDPTLADALKSTHSSIEITPPAQ